MGLMMYEAIARTVFGVCWCDEAAGCLEKKSPREGKNLLPAKQKIGARSPGLIFLWDKVSFMGVNFKGK